MKALVSVDKLKKALGVTEALSRKGVLMSTLEKTYIATSGNALVFYATNLRSSVLCTVAAKVSEQGEILCDGFRILQALQHVSDDQCTITLNGGLLRVTTEKTVIDAPTYPKEDFPVPQDGATVKGITLTVRECNDLFDGVSFAAAPEEVHPELGSIFMRTVNGELIAVATDSFRLAESKLVNQTYTGFDDGVLVPKQAIGMLTKALQAYDPDAVVTIGANDSVLLCATEGLLIRLQTAQGSFPDYERIIPQGSASECTIASSELISALKLCGAFSDSFHKVKITCDEKSGQCIVSSDHTGSGAATVTILAQVKKGDLSCTLNAGYLIPFLQHAHTDAVVLATDGEGRPVLFTPAGSTTYRYVVMPMTS